MGAKESRPAEVTIGKLQFKDTVPDLYPPHDQSVFYRLRHSPDAAVDFSEIPIMVPSDKLDDFSTKWEAWSSAVRFVQLRQGAMITGVDMDFRYNEGIADTVVSGVDRGTIWGGMLQNIMNSERPVISGRVVVHLSFVDLRATDKIKNMIHDSEYVAREFPRAGLDFVFRIHPYYNQSTPQ